MKYLQRINKNNTGKVREVHRYKEVEERIKREFNK